MAVGGSFRSNLLSSLLNALARFVTEAGSEQSTNFHWWDSRTGCLLACRLDLNNPPTAVGGILPFHKSLYRAVVLMTSQARGELIRTSTGDVRFTTLTEKRCGTFWIAKWRTNKCKNRV